MHTIHQHTTHYINAYPSQYAKHFFENDKRIATTLQNGQTNTKRKRITYSRPAVPKKLPSIGSGFLVNETQRIGEGRYKLEALHSSGAPDSAGVHRRIEASREQDINTEASVVVLRVSSPEIALACRGTSIHQPLSQSRGTPSVPPAIKSTSGEG